MLKRTVNTIYRVNVVLAGSQVAAWPVPTHLLGLHACALHAWCTWNRNEDGEWWLKCWNVWAMLCRLKGILMHKLKWGGNGCLWCIHRLHCNLVIGSHQVDHWRKAPSLKMMQSWMDACSKVLDVWYRIVIWGWGKHDCYWFICLLWLVTPL